MEMEVDQSTFLLDLPNEVLEMILDYLPFLAVRKNFRATCKRLYNLCNVERFHRTEVIAWSKESKSYIVSVFQNSFRGCFNLIFSDVTLNARHVTKFFNQHGAIVQTLSFINCKSPPGVLESIIERCGALCSLSIKHFSVCSFSFESSVVPRSTVTSLELVLDSTILDQSPAILWRIWLLFPCVKHLRIEADENSRRNYRVMGSAIFKFIGSFVHLESLRLNVKFPTHFYNMPIFLDLLPKLEKLSLSLDSSSVEGDTFWNTIAFRSKASSIELYESDHVDSWHIEPLLSMTTLKHLSYAGETLHFPLSIFNALVSSKLETISLQASQIRLYEFDTGLPSKGNKTVTDLIFWGELNDFYSPSSIPPFAVSFCGLVHLEIGTVSDGMLKQIFTHQRNLRSLVLQDCQACTTTGFCGKNYKKSVCSINNLQNLEHLSIELVEAAVLKSKMFQKAFNFPRLKYLRIASTASIIFFNHDEIEIPVKMLKACVNLEALHLRHFATPSSAELSPLFQHLKNLNYLYFFSIMSDQADLSPSLCTYVNLKHFLSADLSKLRLNHNADAYHYDEDLDRTVFTKRVGKTVSLSSPKFSFHTIRWINIE